VVHTIDITFCTVNLMVIVKCNMLLVIVVDGI
jgi:hypothetical protein